VNVDAARLPDYVERAFRSGPTFDTTILPSVSGIEQRIINMPIGRCQYTAGYGLRDRSVWEPLLAFCYAQLGQAYGFTFRDWIDYIVTGGFIATGDAVTTNFQLVKLYATGSRTYTRNITLPDSTTLVVYLNGVAQSGSTYDLLTDGIVHFHSAPGTVSITADFQFFVPVRFATDKPEFQLQTLESASVPNIILLEILAGSP